MVLKIGVTRKHYCGITTQLVYCTAPPLYWKTTVLGTQFF